MVSNLVTSLGLMSGTSLDGIDVALLRTDGETAMERGPSRTFAYTPQQRQLLTQALNAAIDLTDRADRRGILGEAEIALTGWHAQSVRVFLKENGLTQSDIDIIGFHGQTVLHRPERQLTVQLGDGQALANQMAIKVAFDLRAADIAAGGQGAPLVPIYHKALAATLGEKSVAFVNIGGVANVTFVHGGHLLAFDTGPGNALLDDWMMRHTGSPVDLGGAAALRGVPDARRLQAFLSQSYFQQPVPKSLDRNTFAEMVLDGLSLEDGAATLSAMTAGAIASAAQHSRDVPALWVIGGGGRKNAAIMANLRSHLPVVKTAEDCKLDGDAMEAEAWAYLAVRAMRGLPLSFPTTTGVPQAMTGGIIALPEV